MKKPLISATDIGAIVKEFLGKKFDTYDPIEVIITRKFFLKPEEKKYFDSVKSVALNNVFEKGKKFETDIIRLLSEKYTQHTASYQIIDYNNYYENNELGKRQRLLIDHILSACCVPDLLVIKDDTQFEILEIKSSDYNTEMIENYKYQVALQGLLLAKDLGKLPSDFTYRIVLQKTIGDKTEAKGFKVGGNKLWGRFSDVEPYQKEIITSLERLWECFENGELEKYRLSFEDMIRPFVDSENSKNERETIELEDPELVTLALGYLEEKEKEKSSKYYADTIKCRLSKMTKKNTIFKLKTDDGTEFKISYSCSKPIYWTEELKSEAMKTAKAIELGMLKKDIVERLSIKI